MSNRNRPNIRKFPVKPGKNDLLKQAVNGIADDMVRSFNEMISAKMDALNWAIDQLPKVLEEASLPPLRFEIADGLYPFLLRIFALIKARRTAPLRSRRAITIRNPGCRPPCSWS